MTSSASLTISDMVAGLNRLMQTTDENLVQVSSLLQSISRGDLTVRMQGGLPRGVRPDAR